MTNSVGTLKRLEGVPEFVGLRGRAFAVAIAYDDERGRLRLLDEIDGRTFGVDDRVVVNGGAEIGNHPLIDFVFAVVTQLV